MYSSKAPLPLAPNPWQQKHTNQPVLFTVTVIFYNMKLCLWPRIQFPFKIYAQLFLDVSPYNVNVKYCN